MLGGKWLETKQELQSHNHKWILLKRHSKHKQNTPIYEEKEGRAKCLWKKTATVTTTNHSSHQ